MYSAYIVYGVQVENRYKHSFSLHSALMFDISYIDSHMYTHLYGLHGCVEVYMEMDVEVQSRYNGDSR